MSVVASDEEALEPKRVPEAKIVYLAAFSAHDLLLVMALAWYFYAAAGYPVQDT